MNNKFNYNSSIINYQVIGTGKPILLIHGFGEDATIWQNQIEHLKDKYQLIIPHLPGSGNSDLIDDMSIDGMAYCMKELLTFVIQKNPIEEVCVLGHSMGGYITLALAEKYPEMFSAFGLIHSSAFADNEEKKAARLKSIEFINQLGSYEFLKSTTPNLFLNKQHPQINALVEQGEKFSPQALIAYYHAMITRPDRTKVLKTFTKPVLFVIGEHDMAIPFAQSMQQCHLPKQPHIHILRNSAHMGMWEEAAKVNTILSQFLTSLS
ncbi:MAG: alpha/beta hydrolase [Chitinophagaceae bacterium]|nr:alpha/beta hydrolase [Chitinophagaceae bacterium]